MAGILGPSFTNTPEKVAATPGSATGEVVPGQSGNFGTEFARAVSVARRERNPAPEESMPNRR